MALPPIPLLLAVAKMLDLNRVFICLEDDDDASSDVDVQGWIQMHRGDWERQVGAGTLEELLGRLLDRHAESRLLVYCPDVGGVKASRRLEQGHLKRHVSWLLPEADSVADLPLRLDSNVFTHSAAAVDCRSAVADVKEWYKIKGAKLVTRTVATWEADKGLQIVGVPFIWDRRADLNGTIVKTTEIPHHPFNFVVEGTEAGEVGMAGIMGTTMVALSRAMNFRLEWKPRNWGEWGNLGEDGLSWDGMVSDMLEGRSDVATELWSSAGRDTVLDFGNFPLIEDAMTILADKRMMQGTNQKDKINLAAFLSVFSADTWFALLATCCAFSAALAVAVGAEKRSLTAWVSKLALGVFQFSASAMQMDSSASIARPRFPWTVRNTLCAMNLGLLLLFFAYTCDLMSYVTTPTRADTIRSFQDIIDRDLTLILIRDYDQHIYLKGAEAGSAAAEVLENHAVFITEEDMNGKAVWWDMMDDDPHGKVFFGSYVNAVQRGQVGFFDFQEKIALPLPVALPKESEFKDLLNYQILKLVSGGLMRRITRVHAVDNKPDDDSGRIFYGGDEVPPVGYVNLSLPSMLAVGGIVAALAVLLAERRMCWPQSACGGCLKSRTTNLVRVRVHSPWMEPPPARLPPSLSDDSWDVLKVPLPPNRSRLLSRRSSSV